MMEKEGFVDIASEAGLDLMGFGMGACWGDYDGDGKDDLFVTNMFSKAGQRVLGDFAEVDPRFVEAASGNFLYRQKEGKFEQLAGYGGSTIPLLNLVGLGVANLLISITIGISIFMS